MAGRKNKSESRPPFRLQHSSPAQQTPARTEHPALVSRARRKNLNVRERELDARQAKLDLREAGLDAQGAESGERLATANADVREVENVSNRNDAVVTSSDSAGAETDSGQARHEGVDEHTARSGNADVCGNEAVLLTAEDFEEGGELVAVPSDEEYMTLVGIFGSAPNGAKAKKSR
ncbi:hypothetical protein LTR53_010864 [Teratosphaeriaceae sp. CCFEE 6253]|nr:hypothetical protein LTR53_010864 [Teratosphaeriaceae sp. CCFEE 6253]